MCKKYCRTWQATDHNTGHALCVAVNWDYKRTIRICNTYWFFKVTAVTRTRLVVTFIRTLHVMFFLSVIFAMAFTLPIFPMVLTLPIFPMVFTLQFFRWSSHFQFFRCVNYVQCTLFWARNCDHLVATERCGDMWRHQTGHKHNARWWRAIPARSRATLTQTRWLWWKFIVLRGNAEKQIVSRKQKTAV